MRLLPLAAALLIAPAASAETAERSARAPGAVETAARAARGAKAAGKWVVVEPLAPGRRGAAGRSTSKAWNRDPGQVAVVPVPGASRRTLGAILDRAPVDAVAIPGPRRGGPEGGAQLLGGIAAARARRGQAAPTVFLDGDRLSPAEAQGPAAAPRHVGRLENPGLGRAARVEHDGDAVRFRSEDGHVLARLKSADLAPALAAAGVREAKDLAGLVPVRILTTGRVHFVRPELVAEAQAGWARLQARMAEAREKAYAEGVRTARARGLAEAEAQAAGGARRDGLVFVYASTFLSGGAPGEGTTNRQIARFVSDDVLTRHARTLFGTDNVFVLNPAGAEAELRSARSGNDYMWFWSEFLLGGRGGQDIQIYHFTGPRMVRAYFEAQGQPVPPAFRDRGIANSVGMRQEWNAAALRNAEGGVTGNMAHIFYDGAPVPMAAQAPVAVPPFEQAGWHKRDKTAPLPATPAVDPRAGARLVAAITREKLGPAPSGRPLPDPPGAAPAARAARLDGAYARVAGLGRPATTTADRAALGEVASDAERLVGAVRPTVSGLRGALGRALDRTRAAGGQARGAIDPAFAQNLERARRLGSALGIDALPTLRAAATREIADRSGRVEAALATGQPVDAMDLYRLRLLGHVHGLPVPALDRALSGGGPAGRPTQVAMGLRAGVRWVESDLGLVRAMIDQVASLQDGLDQAARAHQERLYLSGPISSDDVGKNLALLDRAKERLQAQAPALFGLAKDGLYVVNPGGFQSLLPPTARGNHFMWVWERVLLGNDGGNFEHVHFLGDAWTERLDRELAAGAQGRPLAQTDVDDPRYVTKGVMESAGSRFEWMDVRAANQARARAGKPPVRLYEDGRLLPGAVAGARVATTTYAARGEAPPAAPSSSP